MGDRAEFPVRTLADMAAIPEDRMGRFLAELPAILRTFREIERSVPALAEQARARASWLRRWLPASVFEEATRRALLGPSARLVWVDDDKGLATVNMTWAKGEEPFFSQTERMRASDSNSDQQGEKPSGFEGEASQSGGSEASASPNPSLPSPPPSSPQDQTQ